MKIVWTDQPIAKLDEIFLYIAMDSRSCPLKKSAESGGVQAKLVAP